MCRAVLLTCMYYVPYVCPIPVEVKRGHDFESPWNLDPLKSNKSS